MGGKKNKKNDNQGNKPEIVGNFNFGQGGGNSNQDFKFDFLGPSAKDQDDDGADRRGGRREPPLQRGSVFDFAGKDAQLVPLIQQKLGTMVGKTSGYFETLPKTVQRRISALKKLQNEKGDLDKEYEKELSALEEKYRKKFEPLYEKRAAFVAGSVEPTDADLVPEEEKSEKEETSEQKPNEEQKSTKKEEKKRRKQKRKRKQKQKRRQRNQRNPRVLVKLFEAP